MGETSWMGAVAAVVPHVAAFGIGVAAEPPVVTWVVLGALALAAVFVVRMVVGCAFRAVGLAVLLVLGWLAWTQLA